MDQVCGQCNQIFESEDSFESAKNGKLVFQRDLAYLSSAEAEKCELCFHLYCAFGRLLPANPTFFIRLEHLDTKQPILHISGGWEKMTVPVSYLVYAAKSE